MINKFAKSIKHVYNIINRGCDKKMKAIDIANWFLSMNNYMQNITDTEYITNMKLQKLLYYAQGLHLSKYSKPLFKEKILAWEHGPVVREVYDIFKSYGGDGITYTGTQVELSQDTEFLLEKVYELYGQYSAWKLRNMTHSEKPWQTTPRNVEIKKELIKDYFNETKLCELQ
ncbi:MAG: DUF4065 domain-containing protein [Bacilli bacterium]|nr:DUF4065 domain-containing protein [Bacilli bacterium]MDD4794995.1 DUF4065 domain-containing protein [Bacilli bacterium]